MHELFFSAAKLFPDLTLSATLKEYTERDRTWSSSGALENRDVLLDILSDAMVLAPLAQLAEIQSEVNENTYFYVFTHRSTFSEYDVVKYFDTENNIITRTNCSRVIVITHFLRIGEKKCSRRGFAIRFRRASGR